MKANYVLVKVKSQEKADCAVVAAQFALGLSYKDAYALLAKHGRKSRQTTPASTFLQLGLEARWDTNGKQVGTVMSDMQTGRFVVFTARHFFAVVDGRMFDSQFTSFKSRVKVVFEVPLDNPAVLSRYPYLEKCVALDKLPDMRAINCNRVAARRAGQC